MPSKTASERWGQCGHLHLATGCCKHPPDRNLRRNLCRVSAFFATPGALINPLLQRGVNEKVWRRSFSRYISISRNRCVSRRFLVHAQKGISFQRFNGFNIFHSLVAALPRCEVSGLATGFLLCFFAASRPLLADQTTTKQTG